MIAFAVHLGLLLSAALIIGLEIDMVHCAVRDSERVQ